MKVVVEQVKNVSEIDLKVLSQMYKDMDFVLEGTVEDGNTDMDLCRPKYYLFLRNEFLASLNIEDDISLSKEKLCPAWGFNFCVPEQQGSGIRLRPYGNTELPYHRWRLIENESYNEIRKEVNKAKSFARNIKYSIIVL